MGVKVISGSMGRGAIDIFNEKGIEVIVVQEEMQKKQWKLILR